MCETLMNVQRTYTQSDILSSKEEHNQTYPATIALGSFCVLHEESEQKQNNY